MDAPPGVPVAGAVDLLPPVEGRVFTAVAAVPACRSRAASPLPVGCSGGLAACVPDAVAWEMGMFGRRPAYSAQGIRFRGNPPGNLHTGGAAVILGRCNGSR